jgi:WD repeat-containing protein 22
MYVGGSDDFRGYVWKVPPVTQLTAMRDEISAKEWESSGVKSGTIGMSFYN